MDKFQTTMGEIKNALKERVGEGWLNMGDVDYLEHGGVQVSYENKFGLEGIYLTDCLYGSVEDSFFQIKEGWIDLDEIFLVESEDKLFSPIEKLNMDKFGGVISCGGISTEFYSVEQVVEFCLSLMVSWVQGWSEYGEEVFRLEDFKLEDEDSLAVPYTDEYDKVLDRTKKAVKSYLVQVGITEGLD